jgi:hypothetical protein
MTGALGVDFELVVVGVALGIEPMNERLACRVHWSLGDIER